MFVYIWSLSAWMVDTTFFANDPLLQARGVSGQVLNTDDVLTSEMTDRIRETGSTVANSQNNGSTIDRIGEAAGASVTSIWTYLELLSGSYAFNVLEWIGVPASFITILKLAWPVIVAATIIFYVTGRQ